MPKDAHNKAAEHHENAARSHKTAAEHHGKGDHAKGRENRRRLTPIRKRRTSTPRWGTARANRRSEALLARSGAFRQFNAHFVTDDPAGVPPHQTSQTAGDLPCVLARSGFWSEAGPREAAVGNPRPGRGDHVVARSHVRYAQRPERG